MLNRIKALAAEKGMNINSVEVMLNLTHGTIGKWKNSVPRADTLLRVASFLNTTSSYLLTGKGPAHPEEAEIEMKEYLQKLRDDPNTRIMFDLAETATPEEIKATVAFLKTIRSHGRDSE